MCVLILKTIQRCILFYFYASKIIKKLEIPIF